LEKSLGAKKERRTGGVARVSARGFNGKTNIHQGNSPSIPSTKPNRIAEEGTLFPIRLNTLGQWEDMKERVYKEEGQADSSVMPRRKKRNGWLRKGMQKTILGK